jgi:phage terminase large subunit
MPSPSGSTPTIEMQAVDADFPEKLQFLFHPARYKIAYGGRGGAKSWGFARALLIMGVERPLRVLCGREIQKSIKDSVHQLLRDQIAALGLGGHYDVLDTEIRGKNGTLFLFAGLKHNIGNIQSTEGLDIVWVEEANLVSRDSWETLIPTIRKDGSEIWISFNPKLDTDETYKRFVLNPPRSAVPVKIGWQDNPWFPAVLEEERLDLQARDPDAYQNVWEGHTRQFLDGSIYAHELRKATEESRICSVPYDASKPVHTFWDLGHADATAIWFAQSVGFELRLIDYYANRGQALPHYLNALQSKGYVYGEDWLPHDARSKTIGTGRSVEDMMRAAGRKVQITPQLSVADGINAARTVFGRCYFDQAKCADGLQALRHYRYDTDENGQFKLTPLHDWASDGADAFRYFAVAMKEPRRASAPKRAAPRFEGAWMS